MSGAGGQTVISTPGSDQNWVGGVQRLGPGWGSSPTGRWLLRKHLWEGCGARPIGGFPFSAPAHLLSKQ